MAYTGKLHGKQLAFLASLINAIHKYTSRRLYEHNLTDEEVDDFIDTFLEPDTTYNCDFSSNGIAHLCESIIPTVFYGKSVKCGVSNDKVKERMQLKGYKGKSMNGSEFEFYKFKFRKGSEPLMERYGELQSIITGR